VFFEKDFSQSQMLTIQEPTQTSMPEFTGAPVIIERDNPVTLCPDSALDLAQETSDMVPTKAIDTEAARQLLDTDGSADVPNLRRHDMVTRSQIGIRKPNPRYVCQILRPISLPSGAVEALKDHHWAATMRTEYDALVANDTWELVARAPE